MEQFFKEKQSLLRLKNSIPAPNKEKLKQAILDSIEFYSKDTPNAAVLFSGGIDSTLLALLLSKKICSIELFCVGLKSSHDLTFAESVAEKISLPLQKVVVSEKEIKTALPKVKKIIGSNDFLQLQIALPQFLALNEVKKSNFKVVFSGQGADELFLGYDSFRGILDKKGFGGVKEEQWKKIENFWRDNLSRDQSIVDFFKLDLRCPFLCPRFMKQALAFPVQENLFSEKDFLRKHLLRELAKDFGLPKEVLKKRKKAIQYGSGIGKVLKKIK